MVYDFDLALSDHETLVNFDLRHATEHKAFVHARQRIDKSCVCLLNHCLVQYGDIMASVRIMKCFRSLSARGSSKGGLLPSLAELLLWPVNKKLRANDLVFALDINLSCCGHFASSCRRLSS